jgi:hypothetical protein
MVRAFYTKNSHDQSLASLRLRCGLGWNISATAFGAEVNRGSPSAAAMIIHSSQILVWRVLFQDGRRHGYVALEGLALV